MCYGQFNVGHCCEPTGAGQMDFWCYSSSEGTLSSSRFFSRACANTTSTSYANGRYIEPQWGYERPAPDAQRTMGQTIQPWGSSLVYQLESCAPILMDQDIGFDFSVINNRDSIRYPIIDPTGNHWTIEETDPTKQLITATLHRTNATVYGAIETLAGQVGLIFRFSNKTNYFIARLTATTSKLSIEQVVSGVPFVLASTTIPPFSGGPVTFSVSANGPDVVANASTISGPASCSATVADDGTERFGLWKNSPGVRFTQAIISSLVGDVKHFATVYNVSDTATIAAQTLNEVPPNGPTKYNYTSALIFAGTKGYQHGPGDFGDIGSTVSTLTYVRTGGFDDLGNPIPWVVVGTISDIQEVTWPGGQELIPARHILEDKVFQNVQWTESSFGLWRDPDTFVGYYATITVDLIQTRNEMGFEVIGKPALHGYPKSCGTIIKSIVRRSGPNLPQTPFQAFYGIPAQSSSIFRIKWACIIGDLNWSDRFTPKTAEEIIVKEWDRDVFIYDEQTGSDATPNWQPVSENHIRSQLANPFAVGSGGERVPIFFFDCIPDMTSWAIGWRGQKSIITSIGAWNGFGFDSVLDEDSGYNMASYNFSGSIIDLSFWQPGAFVLGPSTAATMYRTPIPGGPIDYAQSHFKIFGGFDFTLRQNGLVDASPLFLSDRFCYASLQFNSLANAKAFSTASDPNNKVFGTLSTYGQLWMISLDGTVRYPLMDFDCAPNTSNLLQFGGKIYSDRPTAEAAGNNKVPGALSGFGSDVIKDSKLPYSPAIVNPTF